VNPHRNPAASPDRAVTAHDANTCHCRVRTASPTATVSAHPGVERVELTDDALG
jgi:hypothetical protein